MAETYDEQYERRCRIEPHAHVENPTHRGWTLWYDAGEFESGICYRATKWRARSPTGELLEHPDHGHTGSLVWLKAEIDRRMAA